MRTTAGLLAAASLVALVPAPPPAQAEILDAVVVTATRRPETLDESLAPVVVITREEIEQSLALDVADLLRFHAGLEIARNGGPGQLTSVFIRGADSDHSLVLIDGVKVNPGTAGGAALQNISPALVERIEIVKGPWDEPPPWAAPRGATTPGPPPPAPPGSPAIPAPAPRSCASPRTASPRYGAATTPGDTATTP